METNENEKNNVSKPLGCSKGGPEREAYSNTSLSQETRKVSNTQRILTPNGAGKRTGKSLNMADEKN